MTELNMNPNPEESEESERDWRLDRKPAIKKELEEHGYVMVEKDHMDAGRGASICLLWLLAAVAGPLIGAGISQNHFLGAGLGVVAVITGLVLWEFASRLYKKATGK